MAMRLLQKLVEAHELVGEALVPYYRQLLPVFNLCMGSNKNLGDAIDYGQNHTPCLGELAASTLDMFELHGGPSAWLNIKYMVGLPPGCAHQLLQTGAWASWPPQHWACASCTAASAPGSLSSTW